MTSETRDHGGALDAAAAQYGGARADWLDLSTGINPVPYPTDALPTDAWTTLPDTRAGARLIAAARSFWNVPDGFDIVAAPGASALIARMPEIFHVSTVSIPGPTYNEHEAAFRAAYVDLVRRDADMRVLVHPNNPDGKIWGPEDVSGVTLIDESFCDTVPDRSLLGCNDSEHWVLKSFGKFWGLAGLRLGFLIGPRGEGMEIIRSSLGPWAVSGPALHIGAAALEDETWAAETRARLAADADRLDGLMTGAGATPAGGTSLFRLYEVDNAAAWQDRMAQHHVWSRIFPYSKTWLRLGLPAPDRWSQLERALA
jgi:cobalamin biosynthetic protein CobC